MTKPPSNRDLLVDLLAETYGFKLPLREGQRMAVDQIERPRIDAIIAAGWEPSGLQHHYEASQGALSDVLTEHRVLVEALQALAQEWRQHGFGVQSGSKYAEQLLAVIDAPAGPAGTPAATVSAD